MASPSPNPEIEKKQKAAVPPAQRIDIIAALSATRHVSVTLLENNMVVIACPHGVRQWYLPPETSRRTVNHICKIHKDVVKAWIYNPLLTPSSESSKPN